MSCYENEKFIQYINDSLSESERQSFEDHLYICDHCLHTHMLVLESEYSSSVQIIDDHFTNRVMEKIEYANQTEKRKVSRSPLFHYTIAVGFTLMLMFSGVFDQLMNLVSEESMNESDAGSFSNHLFEQTIDLIERMKNNERGGLNK